MSTIKVGTLLAADGSTTTQPSIPALDQRMAKAWMKYDQNTGPTLHGSYNVSSVTDHSTGEFTMHFSTSMGNTNYCVVATGHYGGGANDMGSIGWTSGTLLTASAARFYFMSQINGGTSGSLYDPEEAMITIFGS